MLEENITIKSKIYLYRCLIFMYYISHNYFVCIYYKWNYFIKARYCQEKIRRIKCLKTMKRVKTSRLIE